MTNREMFNEFIMKQFERDFEKPELLKWLKQEVLKNGRKCPFCGSKVKSEIQTARDSYGFYRRLFFKCQNKECGAIVSLNSAKTYKDYMLAVEAWGRRANNE